MSEKRPRICATCKYFKWEEGRVCTAIKDGGSEVAHINNEGCRKAVLHVSPPFFCALHAFQGEEGIID